MSGGLAVPRDRATRRADALATLQEDVVDVWVATSSRSGEPYLVPLTSAWVDERVVLAVDGASRTARNVVATGSARLGVGPTRDVVMIDAVLERTTAVEDDTDLGAAYAARADWDPRGLAGYVLLVLRPVRVQAWRGVDESVGRTLMRDGAWLTDR